MNRRVQLASQRMVQQIVVLRIQAPRNAGCQYVICAWRNPGNDAGSPLQVNGGAGGGFLIRYRSWEEPHVDDAVKSGRGLDPAMNPRQSPRFLVFEAERLMSILIDILMKGLGDGTEFARRETDKLLETRIEGARACKSDMHPDLDQQGGAFSNSDLPDSTRRADRYCLTDMPVAFLNILEK